MVLNIEQRVSSNQNATKTQSYSFRSLTKQQFYSDLFLFSFAAFIVLTVEELLSLITELPAPQKISKKFADIKHYRSFPFFAASFALFMLLRLVELGMPSSVNFLFSRLFYSGKARAQIEL